MVLLKFHRQIHYISTQSSRAPYDTYIYEDSARVSCLGGSSLLITRFLGLFPDSCVTLEWQASTLALLCTRTRPTDPTQ